MKKLMRLVFFAFCASLLACQSGVEELDNVGYLCLSIDQDISTETKALPENYDPKQIVVQIVDAKNVVVKQTDDWKKWQATAIELPVGSYTIKASSNGFDGKEAAFDAPYYAASKQVAITKGVSLQENLICTLANVKVTVNYAPELIAAFKSVSTKVSDKALGHSLDFVSTESRSAYFPVADLTAVVTLINQRGETHTMTKELTGVKARDHYILNYRLAESGQANNITVTVDPSTNTYTYVFTLGDQEKAATLSANAWSSFAELNAARVSGVTADMKFKFQYRKKGEQIWQDAVAEKKETNYYSKVTSLRPNESYEYQLVANDEVIGTPAEFKTEAQIVLQNGGFEDWHKANKVWYAATQSDFEGKTNMWDTSNPGGGAFGYNPTTGDEGLKHSGKSSAKLETQYAVVKLAAASLYYGSFEGLVGMSGAKINFGQPFASRPTALHGYFQYAPKAIDYLGGNQPSNTVQKGDMDICSIYIALAKKRYLVDNTNSSTFIDFANDENIIAYGELPASSCVATDGQWKEFTIDLQYRSLTEKPTHLIIVCSSSKYGDYFTGGKGSTLHLDDFELIYGDNPVVKP